MMNTKLKFFTFLITANLFLVFIMWWQADEEKEEWYHCTKEHRDANVSLSKQLAPVYDLMKNKTGVYVLEEGDKAMITRAWLSEYAEKTIDVQYFIFSADNVGLIATDFLIRAADRGVKVRILVDDFMVEAKEEDLLALDAHPNLEIKIYNPNSNVGKNLFGTLYSMASNYREFNQRMHNKTFIVDGDVAITGGRNIADEYFDYDHEYNFKDRDVLLLGKGVKQIATSFNDFWNNDLSVTLTKVINASDYKFDAEKTYSYLHQYACNPKNFWPQVRERMALIPEVFSQIQADGQLLWIDDLTFVSDVPGKNNGQNGLEGSGATTDTIVGLIRQAKQTIYIQSPYLITTKESRKLLQDAVKRGVKVKILTNSLASTDNLEAFNGYQRDRDDLLKTGVEIFEFKPDALVMKELMQGDDHANTDELPIFGLHAKSMVIDEKIAVVGTFNFDPRSANLNTECITIIHSTDIARKLETIFLNDMKIENAWETTRSSNPDSTCTLLKRVKTKVRRVVPKNIL